MTSCTFQVFLVLWNRLQGLSTPPVHLRLAAWLENAVTISRPRLLLMAFRACGKSTLVGLYCTWLLLQQPQTRIIVLSADLALARKMVRQVRRILERHPLTKHLLPDDVDQWGSDRFTIKRDSEWRDPSMLAKGITTNLTGTRADVIICDDVEVPKTCDSAEKRLQLRERLNELDYILTPDGMMLYVGTPHVWHTIYADSPRKDKQEEKIFLDGFDRMVIPILNADGDSVWPERFPLNVIDDMRRSAGPLTFDAQMMCNPVNIDGGRLNHENVEFYEDELDFRRVNGREMLMIGDTRIKGLSAWWDPSFGRGHNDRSVIAIIGVDDDGHCWLHHIGVLTSTAESETDSATQQCEQVINLVLKYHLPCVHVEINGVGRFLPEILRRECARAGVACGVKEISTKKPKEIRIIETFDVVLAARLLHVHNTVCATPFMTELREWRPGKGRGHDDCLDAVAGAISQQPVAMHKPKTKAKNGPLSIGFRPKQQRAKTDFHV